MKIGILTLSASDNCGSLLQSYALQHVLRERGHDVEIINFITPVSKKMYRVFHPGYIKSPSKFIGQLIQYRNLLNQKLDYEKFRQDHLLLSPTIYKSEDELKELDGVYDTVVCGSDQIWNVYMRDFDKAFLLSWCNKTKRIAYAASLGELKNRSLKDLIKCGFEFEKFLSVSIRERSGKEKFQKEFGKEVKVCLDPTLLLKGEEWKKLIGRFEAPEEEFIFYYSYSYQNNQKNIMVRKFAKLTGLPVYVINSSRWIDGKEKKFGFHRFKKSGPEAFLDLMAHCKYALVESFHGVIFSYVFQKEFWFLEDEEDPDDRIYDLLETIDAQDRVMHPCDKKIKHFINIDYSVTPQKLKERLDASKQYIAEYL